MSVYKVEVVASRPHGWTRDTVLANVEPSFGVNVLRSEAENLSPHHTAVAVTFAAPDDDSAWRAARRAVETLPTDTAVRLKRKVGRRFHDVPERVEET